MLKFRSLIFIHGSLIKLLIIHGSFCFPNYKLFPLPLDWEMKNLLEGLMGTVRAGIVQRFINTTFNCTQQNWQKGKIVNYCTYMCNPKINVLARGLQSCLAKISNRHGYWWRKYGIWDLKIYGKCISDPLLDSVTIYCFSKGGQKHFIWIPNSSNLLVGGSIAIECMSVSDIVLMKELISSCIFMCM